MSYFIQDPVCRFGAPHEPHMLRQRGPEPTKEASSGRKTGELFVKVLGDRAFEFRS
jgi:hypothetical protein